jgi:hypothetical protein
MTQSAPTAWLRADRLVRFAMVPTVLGTAAVGLSISGLALSEVGLDLAPEFPAWLALAGFAVSVAMAATAWVAVSERPGVATGLSVALLGMVVPSWAAWDWMPAPMLPILHAAAPLAVAGATHAGLGWSHGESWPRAVAVVYGFASLGAVLVAVAYDPLADPGCAFTCADAVPLGGSLVSTRIAVGMTAALLTAGAAVAGWQIAVRRREPFALRLGALTALGVLGASWAAHALWWGDGPPGVTYVAAHATAGGGLVVGVLVSAWMVRRNRIAAERLITELTDAHAPAGPLERDHAVEFAVPDED